MKKVFLIPIIIFVLALIGLGIYFSVQETGLPSSKLLYPLYGSVCCEEKGANTAIDKQQGLPLEDKEMTYMITCPVGTSRCYISINPEITCGIPYNRYWKLTFYRSDSTITYDINNPIPSGSKIEFAPYNQVKLDYNCYILGSKKAPTSAKLFYSYIDTKLYRTPAGEERDDIEGTELCRRNAIIGEMENNLLNSVSQQIVNGAKSLIEDLAGKNIDAPQGVNTIRDVGNQLSVGDCYVYLDKWDDYPSLYNVNPLGSQYQGKDVICSYNKGLIQVEEVTTDGGESYLVPTKRLTQPAKFCCEHEECRQTYGNNWNCVDYSCKQEAGYCRSDLDCQPAGGEIVDTNCYREPNTMNFFKWSSECVNNKCTSATKESVKCCPSYCSASGQWCDFEVGCKDPVIADTPCPPNKCCLENNQANYLTKGCDNDLICCADETGLGTCAETCTTPPPSNCPPIWSIFGVTIIPDIGCLIKPYIIAISIIGGVLTFLFALLIFKNYKGFKWKKDKTIIIILSLVIGGLAEFLIWWLFWLWVVLIVLLIIVKVLI